MRGIYAFLVALVVGTGMAPGPASVKTAVAETKVIRVEDGLTLVTATDDPLRLAGILLPQEEMHHPAERYLSEMVDGATIRWEAVAIQPDRYGRQHGHGFLPDGAWLNGALVRAGLALVSYRRGPRQSALLALEQAARQSGRGHWRTGGRFRVANATPYDGPVDRFAIVQGRVLSVAERRHFIYLNFEQDWRRDFTIGIDRKRAEMLSTEIGDIREFKGRSLRIRGWVSWYYGPFMHLEEAGQVEFPEGSAPQSAAVTSPR